MDLWAVFMAANYGHLVEQHAHHMDPDVLALIERGNRLGAVEYKRLDLVRTDVSAPARTRPRQPRRAALSDHRHRTAAGREGRPFAGPAARRRPPSRP